MIEEYIPQLIMVISAGALLVLVGRKVPNSLKDLDKETLRQEKVSEQQENKDFKEKLSRRLEKLLRTVKIFISRSDAKLMEVIRSLQRKREKENGNGQFEKGRDRVGFGNFSEKQAEKDKDKDQAGEKIKEEQEKEEDLEKDRRKQEKKKFGFGLANIRKKINLRRKERVPSDTLKTKPTFSRKPGFFKMPVRNINIAEARKVMFERQEKVLIKKIAINPRDDQAYVALGRLYRDSGNLGDARASLSQALKINKGNISAKKIIKELEEQKPI
ncbi:MAG: hypothetical protein ABIC19_01580 [Patescibacteria group bacterium]|nr:hypothetical protein [Patescibacteria group bacterium]